MLDTDLSFLPEKNALTSDRGQEKNALNFLSIHAEAKDLFHKPKDGNALLPDITITEKHDPVNDLNRRIEEKAKAQVEAGMTPAEKERLKADTKKYQDDMKQWEEAMRRWERMIGMIEPPKGPAMPESLSKYLNAVEEKKEAIAAKLKV